MSLDQPIATDSSPTTGNLIIFQRPCISIRTLQHQVATDIGYHAIADDYSPFSCHPSALRPGARPLFALRRYDVTMGRCAPVNVESHALFMAI